MNHTILKTYAEDIAFHLESALQLAQQMQQLTLQSEGDSDLHRKLAFYLTPSLVHWVSGPQAGNMKDLSELFARRAAEQGTIMQTQSHSGDGHDVLTKPSA